MSLKLLFLLAASPVFYGSIKAEEKALFERFLKAVETGTGFERADFVDLPTTEEGAFLLSLKGCESTMLETVGGRKNRGFGVMWDCVENPKSRAAVIYLKDKKIDRILPSTVTKVRP